ncbi:hypothetical protein [Salibacterium qingdaonense]|uniref:Uncharacterized protein n=1 Tax=Salibacterium qingdaonense TaxID=266892 RepID=A0A1I4PIB5_9BACI|nr:hypothetical protein [Salibacterium qingdaonense]SFM27581.1 hypothetical protein SAMN04488054_1278 [Salibacterium qingdaonense]
MNKASWKLWQKEVIREDYTKPEMSESLRRKRIEQVNRKYGTNHMRPVTQPASDNQ